MIVAETPRGQLRLQNDEAIVDSKVADAAGIRVGSRTVPGESGGGGKVSFDRITEVAEQNRRTELAFLHGTTSHLNAGELSITVWNGTEPITDASQQKVAEFRHNEIEFRVPVKFAGGAIAGSARVTRFYTDGGKFCFNFQDDTGLPAGIVYDTHGNADETTWTAVGRLNMGPL